MKTLPLRSPLRSLISLALLLPLASCVYVRVRGDLPEDAWLSELVDEDAPATFERCDDMKLRLKAFLWGKEGSLATSFACAEADLDPYFESVCENVVTEIGKRDCHVSGWSDDAPHRRTLRYEGEDRGEVVVAIQESPGDVEHPYRLELSWKED
jgi:hypothetical protein